jgi:hypothetical protein
MHAIEPAQERHAISTDTGPLVIVPGHIARLRPDALVLYVVLAYVDQYDERTEQQARAVAKDWQGWGAARFDKAMATLVEAGAVIESQAGYLLRYVRP